jgi:hypothetical protein
LFHFSFSHFDLAERCICSDPHFVAVLRVLKITTLALTRAADLGLTDSPKPLWKLSPTVQIRIAGVGGDVRRMCEVYFVLHSKSLFHFILKCDCGVQLIGNFVSIPALPRLASTSMKSVLLDIASAVGNSPQAIRAIVCFSCALSFWCFSVN